MKLALALVLRSPEAELTLGLSKIKVGVRERGVEKN